MKRNEENSLPGQLTDLFRRNRAYSITLLVMLLFYLYSAFTGWAWFNFVDSEKSKEDPHSRTYNHK